MFLGDLGDFGECTVGGNLYCAVETNFSEEVRAFCGVRTRHAQTCCCGSCTRCIRTTHSHPCALPLTHSGCHFATRNAIRWLPGLLGAMAWFCCRAEGLLFCCACTDTVVGHLLSATVLADANP